MYDQRRYRITFPAIEWSLMCTDPQEQALKTVYMKIRLWKLYTMAATIVYYDC